MAMAHRHAGQSRTLRILTMNAIGARSMRFRVQIYDVLTTFDRGRNPQESAAKQPNNPPAPIDGEDPSYWMASYRRWSMENKQGSLEIADFATEIGTMGFGDDPQITPGMFLKRFDPATEEIVWFRSVARSENSSGVGFRWYVTVESVQNSKAPR